MAWDFETDAEYQAQLDWAGAFVRDEVEPLKEEIRKRRLWATHLGPELGGEGHGQLKLALLNEILGRSGWAPLIFGCQAPDTGNAEIIAHFGTPGQKERYLRPLLDGEFFSSNARTAAFLIVMVVTNPDVSPYRGMSMFLVPTDTPGVIIERNVGLADGPTEVHKVTVARQVLRDYSPSDDLWPSQHIPRRLAAAREKYADYLEHEVGNQ